MTSEPVTVAACTRWLRDFAEVVATEREHLTALDAAIGDADHGANLDRGLRAVLAAVDSAAPEAVGPLFTKVGMTLVSTVGGASGPLFGTFFLRLGSACGDRPAVTAVELAAAFRAGLDGVVARGKAEPGDKTMVDALTPAVAALERAAADGVPLAEALPRAAEAAEQGAAATVPWQARKGRASYLGERSIGHQDPGATTVALLFRAAVPAG